MKRNISIYPEMNSFVSSYNDGKIEIEGEVEDSVYGGLVSVPLKLKVSGKAEYWIGWDMALLMHNHRIDGFGWEGGPFPDILNGGDCNGWHRHVWDPISRNADGKTCVDIFDVNELSAEDFVTWGLRAMKILYNRRDDGPDDLF
jgi:hypothetical protein